MFETVLVGYDGSDGSEDAVALARTLVAEGGRIVAACQYWYEPVVARVGKSGPGPAVMGADAEAALAGLAVRVGNVLETRAVPSGSPARALHEVAEDLRPDAVVVGSPHRGSVAQAVLGGTAERLLHGSPCAVAVAPRGYKDAAPRRLRRIGVGFCSDPEAAVALRVGHVLAGQQGAALVVVEAFDEAIYAPVEGSSAAYEEWVADARAGAEETLAGGVAVLAQRVDVATELVEDPVVPALRRAAADVDLLVMGSRAYGPLERVVLGSAVHALLSGEGCPCPLLITPRGAEAPAV